ncbi:hypothetical protein MICAF_3600012 [Microcystis aeruginosa PCC 9807]|uniref:Uncharacterized protein n=1 Tax=Microcystis aeruginosa PCC 9807 TaxID=1160283 RepID=I4H7Y4_MICAE|nr:hypothetical protein MICAF_3600012 [Microcystis aeruginosa PCC 9807]
MMEMLANINCKPERSISPPTFLTLPTAAYFAFSIVRACSGDIASTFSWKTFPELLLTCATKVGIEQISYQLSVISYQFTVYCLQQKTSHSPIPFKQDLGLNPGFSVSAGPGDKTL